MEQKTTLVVMAAGLGKRFGSLKQLETVSESGNVLLDYSLYDAKQAGFDQVVFIIRNSFAKEFHETIGERAEKLFPVSYVYQEFFSGLPDGFIFPDGREKPWGTGHAVLCAADAVRTPFGVINADDYYGRDSFRVLHDYLITEKTPCMVAFRLDKTLSEHGTVSRGICEVENGYLKRITETTNLDKNSPFPPCTPVSMNLWGFQPEIFSFLKKGFLDFLSGMQCPEKDEFYLPAMVDRFIHETGERVRVLSSEEQWYGVTYREDLHFLKQAIQRKTQEGLYFDV